MGGNIKTETKRDLPSLYSCVSSATLYQMQGRHCIHCELMKDYEFQVNCVNNEYCYITVLFRGLLLFFVVFFVVVLLLFLVFVSFCCCCAFLIVRKIKYLYLCN